MPRLLLFFVFCGVCSAGLAEDRILLISHPKVWSAPSSKSPAKATAWQPGKRVSAGEKKTLEGGGGLAENAWFKIEDGKIKGWLPDAYLAPPPQPIDPAELKTIGAEPVDRFHGIPPEYQPVDLIPVGPLYDQENKARLRREAAENFTRMVGDAKHDGIELKVVSGYRAWSKQQDLYEKRVRESGLDQKTVAKPGHSEHQLGTAVDLIDGDEANLLKESFGATAAGQWLKAHAPDYGFANSFTRHNQPQTGCAPEPWHYRYWGGRAGQGQTRRSAWKLRKF